MKKVTLGLAVVLSTAAILSACSSGNSESSASSANASSNGTEKSEKVTLKFWYPGTDEILTGAVKDVITKFEQAHTDIHVEPTFIPWADYFQKLTVAYSGGLQPDVHGLGFGQLISTVNQGKYLDLTPYIQKDQWAGEKDFFPDILEAGQYKSGQYGLLLPEIRPLAWRKDFFKEAGLDPETPPKTFDEIFDFAEKLKVVNGGTTERAGIDIQTSNGEQSYLSLLFLLGEDFYDADGNPTFDSPKSIELVQKMVDLYKSGAIIPSNQQQINGTPFQNSQAAISFTSAQGIAELRKTVGEENIGWALPPAGPEGERTALMLGTFLTAAQKTKHPEAAWEFIKFFFEDDNVLEFTTKTGAIPPLQSLKDDYVKLGPAYAAAFEALNDAKGYGASGNWAINVKYLRLALEEAYNGIRPVEEALKANADLAREEIESAK
ncbi:ABC transporter substrate-binding protein [Paenibacillus glycanilyticus]|uniref:ABC transporter substrate-binding protein n=1 Tax=Paenibacillus glycanilyticus TaxID=126569 RepID=UPI000FDC0BA3|nr:ABC transporter substrate-binding protein [Paenibacillus glycanilyticus]